MNVPRNTTHGSAGASAERKARTIRAAHRKTQLQGLRRTAPYTAAAATGAGWLTAAAAGAATPGIAIGAGVFAFGIGMFATRSREAVTWGKGARGERATGRQLDRLPGWVVLHDRAIPGSRANLDHILIGPGGLLYLDTKHWTARPVTIQRGTLWYGGDKTKSMQTVLWEASHLTRILGVPARAVVSFHRQPQLPITDLTVDGRGTVTVLPADVLGLWLKNLRPILSASAVEDLARRADRAFPPHTA